MWSRLLVSLLVLVALCGCASHKTAAPAPAQTTTSTGSLTEAHSAAAALRKLSADPENFAAASIRPRVAGREREAVPQGAVLVPDENSWMPDRHGGGVMAVTMTQPGKVPVNYAVILVRERGAWKVLATIPTSSDPKAKP